MKYLVVIKSDWQTIARLDVEADDPHAAIRGVLEKDGVTESGTAYAIPMSQLEPVEVWIDFTLRLRVPE